MNKEDRRKKIAEIYIKDKSAFMEVKKNMTEKEWMILVGVYDTLIESFNLKKKGNKKCLN